MAGLGKPVGSMIEPVAGPEIAVGWASLLVLHCTAASKSKIGTNKSASTRKVGNA